MSIFIVLVIIIILYIAEDTLFRYIWNLGLSGEVSVYPDSIYEGEEIIVSEVLYNEKIIPLPWIWVKFSMDSSLVFEDSKGKTVSDNSYRNDMFYIMGYQKLERKLKAKATKRGYYRVKDVKIYGCNIFYTNKLDMNGVGKGSVTVYPRLIDNAQLDSLFTKITGENVVNSFVNPDPFEFAGIREYQPNDSFKSINFNASAKANQLLVNVNKPTMQNEILIVVDIDIMESRTDNQLWEESIRLAATVATYYIESGFSVGLVTNCKDLVTGELNYVNKGIGTGVLDRICECLARMDTSKRVALQTKALKGENSLIVYISSCYSNEANERFSAILSEGAAAQWVLPIMSYDLYKLKDEVQNRIVWRVDDNASKT